MVTFFLELKSLCKSYKFLVLILILLFFQLVYIPQAIENCKNAEKTTPESHRVNIRISRALLDSFQRSRGAIEITPEQFEASLKFYQYRVLLEEERYESYVAQDWPTYNRQNAVSLLLYWEYSYQSVSPTPLEFFGQEWSEITRELEFPIFEVHPSTVSPVSADKVAPHMLLGTFLLDLTKTNLHHTGPYDNSAWSIQFNFLRSGLPSILGAIVLLLTVNILHRDRNFGTFKIILSSPKSRTRYLFRKLSLGVAASVCVIVLPQLLAILISGAKCGFQGLDYPVLVDKYVLSNLTVFPDKTFNTGFLNYGLSKVRVVFNIARLGFYEFIPIWQFFGLAAVQILLYVIFCTALAMLISILIKNEIMAHIVAAGTFVVGNALGSIIPRFSTTAWDFFSKGDMVTLLEGNHASTYLSSLATLSISTILLFILSAVIFRKQSISK